MIKSSDAYLEAVTADARRMYVKAVVDIIDPDMTEGGVTASVQEPGISRPEQVWDKEFSLTANYAGMEPNRWILDGSYILRPGDAASRDWEAGLVGALLSGEDGTFPAAQWARIAFENVSILQACSIAFSDRPEDGVGADFTVEVFSKGVAYYTKTVTGNADALVSITGFRVNNPDAIRVTVTRWSLPGRRMRIAEMVLGVYEVWTGDEMCEFSVKHQGDPTCLTLPYGTASVKMDNLDRRFDMRTKDGVFLMIEERQGVQMSMGAALPDGTVEWKPLGVFYQHNGGWMESNNSMTMTWELVDIIGLLSGRTFNPPAPLPTTLKGWLEALAAQLGENFQHRVRVDAAYADLPVTAKAADIEGMTCGDILRFVCMATGTWPRADASTGYLTAEPLWNEGNKLTLDNLNRYPAMMANEDAASVTVNGYAIEGTAPACGNTVEVTNPFLPDGKRLEAAKTLLTFYGGNRMETLGRGDPASEIGDVDVVWLAEGNAASARRVRQELSISNGVLKNCSSAFLRGDGLFLFENRVQFLESGTFIVPPGVYRLRVVLVGHGGHGLGGANGGWENYTNRYMGMPIYACASTPEHGKAGGGGKVWSGVIDVNPGQVLQIVVQPESGDTTLWKYSSGDGQSYPNGFTDVATGDVYGRSGGKAAPGSGNGGSGGKAGSNGEWYIQARWYYDDGHVGGSSEGGIGVDPGYDAPGHWEQETVIVRDPKDGAEGKPGSTGCAIIYWEKP